MDIGESMVETLTFRVQTDLINQEEAVPLRFTREGLNEVRVTHAEPMALDGNALMANSTVRTVLSMLGYQQIDEHVPVTLNALLVNLTLGLATDERLVASVNAARLGGPGLYCHWAA